jgi:hypothetical protein
MVASCIRTCFLAAALAACGGQFEPGLANAPSIERKTEPRNQNDSISNGPEGCSNADGGPSVASTAGGCAKGAN